MVNCGAAVGFLISIFDKTFPSFALLCPAVIIKKQLYSHDLWQRLLNEYDNAANKQSLFPHSHLHKQTISHMRFHNGQTEREEKSS